MPKTKSIQSTAPKTLDEIWADDRLDRREIANDFISIFRNAQPTDPDAGPVIAINGVYGSGKSFFVERLRKQMIFEEELVLFFDAWKDDYAAHPLPPLLIEFDKQLNDSKALPEKLAEDAKKLLKVGKAVVAAIAPEGAEAVVNANFPGLGTVIKPFVKITKKALAAGSNELKVLQDKYHSDIFDSYRRQKSDLKLFKVELSKFAADYHDKSGGKRIYIFVDEIERCRPTFAVELLEVIKHMFSVKNIVFILSTSREQLKHTVSNLYGVAMDGDGYLRRFVNYELTLPPALPINLIAKYTPILQQRIPNQENRIQDTLKHLTDWAGPDLFDLKPREIERAIEIIEVGLLANPLFIWPEISSVLAALKIRHERLYNKLGTTIIHQLPLVDNTDEEEKACLNKLIKGLKKNSKRVFFELCLKNKDEYENARRVPNYEDDDNDLSQKQQEERRLIDKQRTLYETYIKKLKDAQQLPGGLDWRAIHSLKNVLDYATTLGR